VTPSSPTRANNAIDHVGANPKSVTLLTLWRSQGCSTVILPESTTPPTMRRPRACKVIVLPKPAMSLTPRCHWPHAIPEPVASSSFPSLRHLWACNATLHIFLCHSSLQILNLICYIALICYTLLHCFCSAALLWYATLSHCFDILHYYIAFVLLHCSKYSYIITLLWYATHCSLECGCVSHHSRL
jgi:hypothetical protein